jgi:hypothetical protein
MTSIDPRNLGEPLEKAAAKFRTNSDKRMARRNTVDAPKESLFHYTSRTAFENMLSTEEFWLTSIYHMDDTEELSFGFDVCGSVLRSALERGDFSGHTGRVLQLFIEPLIEPSFREEIKTIVEFYSFSFGMRDDPKQWKRYGKKGKGIAIGLSPQFFFPLPIENPKPEERIYVGKVAYGERNAKIRHARVVHSVIDVIKREYHAGAIPNGQVAQALFRRLVAEMYCEVLWNCVTTKGDKWKQQNETRLLVLNRLKDPELPIENTHGRPYVKIPQPTLKRHLDEVMVGPDAEAETEKQVLLFLTKHGLGGTRVTRSSAL